MFMSVTCPACGEKGRVPESAFGQEVMCPKCGGPVPCGPTDRQPLVRAASPVAAAESGPGESIRYSCPRCKRSLESPVSFAGQKLNCPGCNQRLQIPQPSTPAPPPINKTVLATEEQAGAPSPPAPPAAVRPLDTLAVVEEAPAKRESGRPARRENCLECGANLSDRDRVQTCSDCGATFCSAGCYREHRYYAHSRRKKKKRRPERIQCPYCDSTERPRTVWVISQSGWILFAVLLFVFFPLCWVGLLMTDPEHRCYDCGRRLD
jgi:hypothetical protein